MKLAKDILGLAAEFAVASELCRKNVYAQLTLGLRKRTDILVETEKEMFRIQVKSKQGNEWPGVKGIYGKDLFLVLVDFKDRKENERPDFYILTVEDWVKVLKKNLKDKIKRGEVTIDIRNMPTWKDKYQGMGLKPEMIKEHRERWDKIKKVVR